MNRDQKVEAVTEMTELFGKAQAAYVVNYQGCTCQDITSLRGALKPAGAKFAVVKNNLAKRAIAEGHFAGLEDLFVGPTALIWSDEDPVTPAKLLSDFAKDQEAFSVKGGVVDGEVVDPTAIEALAKLPSKEELLSMLLSLMNAPATRLLQTMNAPASSLVRLLGAWKGELENKGDS